MLSGTLPNASKCHTCAPNSQQRDPSSGAGCTCLSGFYFNSTDPAWQDFIGDKKKGDADTVPLP